MESLILVVNVLMNSKGDTANTARAQHSTKSSHLDTQKKETMYQVSSFFIVVVALGVFGIFAFTLFKNMNGKEKEQV
jgi:flagellar biosynthesis/type III secretory pathway M-ring protein FliF/YscJ